MARLSEFDRRALVSQFIAKVESLSTSDLQQVNSQLHRDMGNGKLPIGSDVDACYRVLAYLKNRIAYRLQEEERREKSPEELEAAEAKQLARAHGVSENTAAQYVRRKSPFDTMRRNIQAAPQPEAPPPTIFEDAHQHKGRTR